MDFLTWLPIVKAASQSEVMFEFFLGTWILTLEIS